MSLVASANNGSYGRYSIDEDDHVVGPDVSSIPAKMEPDRALTHAASIIVAVNEECYCWAKVCNC